MLFLVFYFATFLLFLFTCGLAGYWILQPLGRAVKGKRRPTRFSMIDFIWLSILVTVALAPLANFAGSTRDRNTQLVTVISAMMAVFVVVMVWWRGVATLSGLDIFDNWRRGVFLILVLPTAIGVSIVGVPMLVVLFVQAVQGEARAVLLWLACVALMFLLAITFRYISYWVLAGARETDAA